MGQDGPSLQEELFNFYRSMVIVVFRNIEYAKVISLGHDVLDDIYRFIKPQQAKLRSICSFSVFVTFSTYEKIII